MQSGDPIPSGARSEKIASGSRKSVWRTDAEYGSDVERRVAGLTTIPLSASLPGAVY
jgi:hypothetical protein